MDLFPGAEFLFLGVMIIRVLDIGAYHAVHCRMEHK